MSTTAVGAAGRQGQNLESAPAPLPPLLAAAREWRLEHPGEPYPSKPDAHGNRVICYRPKRTPLIYDLGPVLSSSEYDDHPHIVNAPQRFGGDLQAAPPETQAATLSHLGERLSSSSLDDPTCGLAPPRWREYIAVIGDAMVLTRAGQLDRQETFAALKRWASLYFDTGDLASRRSCQIVLKVFLRATGLRR